MSPQARNWFAPFAPDSSTPWDFELAHRLHRRSGFGADLAELRRDQREGFETSLARVLEGRVRTAPESFGERSSRLVRAAVASGAPERLKAAWLHRMLLGPDPLRERMNLFWHDHFATSDSKLSSLGLMWSQNEVFRQHAFSPFEQLLRAVLADPALPLWLDAIGTTRDRPNQNLGRELLELFTLGVGNYEEHDVLEASRALTGLSIVNGRVEHLAAHHDDGWKTILGVRDRFDVDSLVSLLCRQPATARRITHRLVQYFLGDGTVPSSEIDALALQFAERGLDVQWLVATILRSHALFCDESRQGKVLDPVGFVLGAVRALEIVDPIPDTIELARAVASMGLDLYFPPSVGGWEGEASWLDPRSLAVRARFAVAIASGSFSRDADVDPRALAERHGFAADPSGVAEFGLRIILGITPERSSKEFTEGLRSLDRGSNEAAGDVMARILASPEAQVC